MNELVISIGQKKKMVKIHSDNRVELDGKVVNSSYSKISDYLYLIKINERVFEVTTTKKSSEDYSFSIDGRQYDITVRTTLQEKANDVLKQKEALSKHENIKAPMPGLILKIKKNIGEQVILGEPLIVLEAMKMENEIRSPSSGTITDIMYSEGESIEKDAVILIIE